MNIAQTLKVIQKTMTENSPAILTGLGVAGVITTAVMAVRATPKALIRIAQERDFRGGEGPVREDEPFLELSMWDVVKVTWTVYIPTVSFGATTIACIIGANTIASKKSTALAAAYSVAETALKEYQSKVVETLGASADQKVRDSVAKDRIEKNPPPPSSEVYVFGIGEVLCYDSLSGRYFKSSMEAIRKAQNDINAQCIDHMYASMNEFYTLIGLATNDFGETTGWRADHRMELVFSTCLSDKDIPCLSLGYREQPLVHYWKEN